LIYCLNVPVTVGRIYSAFLAVRLQDRLAHATRRVLPLYQREKAPPKLKSHVDSSLAFTDLATIEFEEEVDTSDADCKKESTTAAPARMQVASLGDADFELKGERSSDGLCQEAEHIRGKSKRTFMSWLGPKLGAPAESPKSDSSRLETCAPPPLASPRSQASAPCTMGQRFRRRLHIRSKTAVALSLCLLIALAAGFVSIWVFQGQKEKTPVVRPSSCSTAQNATATCAHFEFIPIWDPANKDYLSASAETQDDCCAGCDRLANCDGWVFSKMARTCRWIRFLEEPCASNPGDLKCRCTTHFGTAFGFRPKSQIVWVQRERSR
jgi:hypothetical protein